MPNNNPKPGLEVAEKTSIALKVALVLGMISAFLVGTSLIFSIFYQPQVGQESKNKTVDQLWVDFKNTYGSKWQIEWQSINETKVPKAIKGGAIDIKNLSGGVSVNEDNIDVISKRFLQEQNNLLRLDTNKLKIYREFASLLKNQANNTEVIHYQQQYQNIPVHKALTTVGYKNDRIIFYKSFYYPDITVNTNPEINKEEAFKKAKNFELSGYSELNLTEELSRLNGYEKGFATQIKKDFNKPIREKDTKVKEEALKLKGSSLEIYPVNNQGNTSYHLAWRLEFELITEPLSKPIYYIDAHSGSLLDKEDSVFYQVSINDITGTVTGSIYPHYPPCEFGQTPCNKSGSETKSFSNENVSVESLTTQTDELGQYNLTGLSGSVTLTSELNGPFVNVDNLAQVDAKHTASLTVPSTHDWNWQNFDTSYKKEESNVFYHTNLIHNYFTRGEPFDIHVMDFPMRVVVSENGVCNAYSTGDEIHFFKDGDYSGWGHCEATSLGSDVIYHEYTHSVTEHIYGPGVLVYEGESGAMHEGYSDYFAASILDRSTIGDGIFPETIRNLDNNNHYPEDIVGEVHYDSQIFSGALWDTRKKVGAEITDALVIQAEKLFPMNFQQFLEFLLLVDDTDGDLTNGTPHITDICDSFVNKHGIWSDYCIGFMSKPTAMITLPDTGSVFGKTTIDINGIAYSSVGGNFQNYVIKYGPGENPTEWKSDKITLYANGTEQRKNQFLGSFDLSSLAGGYTVRLTVNDTAGSNYHTIFITTGVRDNWPKNLGHWTRSSPTIADIDPNYPGQEILATSWNNKVWAFHQDGTVVVPGWPRDLGFSVPDESSIAVADIDPQNNNGMEVVVGTIALAPNNCEEKLFVISSNGQDAPGDWPKAIFPSGFTCPARIEASPTIADIDNNLANGLEIIIPVTTGGSVIYVYAWHADGTLINGWPQKMMAEDGVDFYPAPAVADIDPNYTGKEIILYSDQYYAYAWHADGTPVTVWPKYIDFDGPTSSSVIADIDNNPSSGLEIITNTSTNVEARSSNGEMLPHWPKNSISYEEFPNYIGTVLYSTISVADIDENPNDGLEIVDGINNKIYVWHYDGSDQTGWPKTVNAYITSNPLLIDLDPQAAGLEIVASGWNPYNQTIYIYAWHADGSMMEGWPLVIKNQFIGSSPVISDIDGNGTLELVINYTWGGLEDAQGSLAVFDLTLPAVSTVISSWSKFHRDIRNTGFYNQCSDFTQWGQCNPTSKQYCNNGKLGSCPTSTPYCNTTTNLCEAKCTDGTPFNQCSTRKPMYCNSKGQLTSACLLCGCPSGQTCKKMTGYPAGKCVGTSEPTPAL